MKKISVDHLARVEGNGGISATIDGKVVSDVKFSIYEGPRLIEKLTLGLTPEEDVSMSPRICAICTLSHKNAVLRAMENALQVEIHPKSYLCRELMHMGEMIESHSLHVYYLALPDYLGFPNAIAMASDFEFEVKIALEMKHFANHIMKVLSGRYIHGENPIIGGFGKFPSREELLFIKNRAIQFMPFVKKTVELFCELDYPDVPEQETVYACCEPGNNKYGFWGDEIVLSTGEKFFRDDYKNLTNEYVVSHSYCKRSRYQGEPYSVGALARVNNLGDRLSGETSKMYEKYFNKRWTVNPLFHNAAQALEISYCFERIVELVNEILEFKEDPEPVAYTVKNGKGTGLVEAPRGLLIHHHEVKDGRVSNVDIVTPTAQNAEDIEKYCHTAAQKLLDSRQEDQIKPRMELVVRAFDPCISCSAHMAEVKHVPKGNWKTKLKQITEQRSPVFIGVGKPDFRDDASGIKIAEKLRDLKLHDVWLESEIIRDHQLERYNKQHTLIFFDAVDFNEKAGKITVLSMESVLNHSQLSHKFIPFVSNIKNPNMLNNAYVVGIQPESVQEGTGLSSSVQKAVNDIINHLNN
ncbi:MAG: hydrogenase maturation protease [Candidatus Aminicenantes bacterium]|nr:hydrogenase maturation protease [Candidatus Aminicenantes bacterium]